MNTRRAGWWGTFHLDVGQTSRWEIGPRVLTLSRHEQEWEIAWRSAPDPEGDGDRWRVVHISDALEKPESVQRFVFRRASATVTVSPALADRPVVTRPVTPISVPPGEEAAIFVGSPLWVRIEVGDPPQLLQEIPIVRPSDTWIGPSTRDGELAYASRTSGRLQLEELLLRPHRAVTRTLIRNRAESALQVERLSLPVPYLSLFGDSQGRLWTESVTLQRETESQLASLVTEELPPAEAVAAKLITGPRKEVDKGRLVRAFGALFGS